MKSIRVHEHGDALRDRDVTIFVRNIAIYIDAFDAFVIIRYFKDTRSRHYDEQGSAAASVMRGTTRH